MPVACRASSCCSSYRCSCSSLALAAAATASSIFLSRSTHLASIANLSSRALSTCLPTLVTRRSQCSMCCLTAASLSAMGLACLLSALKSASCVLASSKLTPMAAAPKSLRALSPSCSICWTAACASLIRSATSADSLLLAPPAGWLAPMVSSSPAGRLAGWPVRCTSLSCFCSASHLAWSFFSRCCCWCCSLTLTVGHGTLSSRPWLRLLLLRPLPLPPPLLPLLPPSLPFLLPVLPPLLGGRSIDRFVLTTPHLPQQRLLPGFFQLQLAHCHHGLLEVGLPSPAMLLLWWSSRRLRAPEKRRRTRASPRRRRSRRWRALSPR